MITNAVAFPRFPEPEKPRWSALRAGLLNLWEYDDQTFIFHKGRLLLRGRNESGKTKALEVLFPFLLDGNHSPQRLDPFGSTARLMQWNLLGDAHPDVQISIGYVWLEFGRLGREGPEFFTIGAGFRATRSTKDLKAWYFTTPLRVGVDFALAAESREPRTWKALEEILGDRGKVWERREDYRREVNRTLFGMQEDQYSALIDALLQLRRPQLSRGLDLKQVSEFLTASLPPLDSNLIHPIAEGFDRLDRHREERDAAERNLKVIQSFEKVYRDYLRIVAKSKAGAITGADSAYHKAREELKSAETRHQGLLDLQAKTASRIEELERRFRELGGSLEALRASDEYKAVGELDRAEVAARDQGRQVEESRRRVEDERRSIEKWIRKLRTTQETLQTKTAELERVSGEARKAATRASLERDHGAIETAIVRGVLDPAKTALDAIVRARREAITEIKREADHVLREDEGRVRARSRLTDSEDSLRIGIERSQQARRQEDEVRKAYADKVVAWMASSRILGAISDVSSALETDEPERIPDLVFAAAEHRRSDMVTHEAEAEGTVRKAKEEVEGLRYECDSLRAATHSRPEAPKWRAVRPQDRAGAPLYMLCEFAGTEASVEAGIEAALESAGFLDAWVTPEGTVLDPHTMDVLFKTHPMDGPTLADYLRPTERSGVSSIEVERVLRTIPLLEAGRKPLPDVSCWISIDGRWRNGPLHGAWSKTVAEFVGETARERARERRLAELTAALTEAETRLASASERRDRIRQDRAALEAEVRSLPTLTEFHRARAATAEVELEAGRRRELRDGAAREAYAAEKRLADAMRQRDTLASERGLSSWIDALADLNRLTSEYRESAIEAVRAAQDARAIRTAVDEARTDHDDAVIRCKSTEEELANASERLDRLRGRLVALRETAGQSREAVVRKARELEEEISSLEEATRKARNDKSATDVSVGQAGSEAGKAKELVAEQDARRKAAEAEFRSIAGDGLLVAAGFAAGKPIAEWTYTDALLEARRIDAETGGVDAGDGARQKAENKLLERHNDLTLALPSEFRAVASLEKSVWVHSCSLNGRRFSPAELLDHLGRDLEDRDRRLGEEERKLLESFLSGETREHLRTRLRGARELVDEMNAQLEQRPTPSGMRVKLKWEVGDDAPAGASQAIDLLMKSAGLMTDSDRKALKDFLQDRLGQAREGAGERSLMDRMADVLDYRKWHEFSIEHRTDASGWKLLTKKAHAAGSGGQKAMVMHLPLFAAAAAFYQSAQPGSARVIALDEAFAGIDRQARAGLMGLLAAFDLDFVMTSFEEWGCYEELDGLSTYHLSREPGLAGVYAERFLWDGKERIHAGEE